METIQAVFENGVFRPTVAVHLPERTVVEFEPRQVNGGTPDDSWDEVYEVLSRRYASGHSDTAERHNEHQP